jgi:predicted ATP-dependent serine protease
MAININKIYNERIKATPLPKEYKDFLGEIPLEIGWTILLFGGAGSGKSSYALKLSNILARHGRILYSNNEESLHGCTLQEKIRRLKIIPKNIYFINEGNESLSFDESLNKIKRHLNTKRYKYCVIDSVTEMCNSRKDVLEILELKNKYSEISFIFIVHADKTEKTYIGPSILKHKVDIAIEFKKGVAYEIGKNRYKKNFDVMEMKVY